MRFMIIVRASRAIILYLLERCWGLNSDTARRLGLVLCQGGEFAFALLAADAIHGVIGEPIANLLTLAVTLSMAPARDTRRHNKGGGPRLFTQENRRHSVHTAAAAREEAAPHLNYWGS
jgi:hypothetical protein